MNDLNAKGGQRPWRIVARAAAPHLGVTDDHQPVSTIGDDRSDPPFRAPQSDGTSQYVHVTVSDADRHFEHATQWGVRVVQAPVNMPFGERQYTVQDNAGHWWTFSQHVADVRPEEWGTVVANDGSAT